VLNDIRQARSWGNTCFIEGEHYLGGKIRKRLQVQAILRPVLITELDRHRSGRGHGRRNTVPGKTIAPYIDAEQHRHGMATP
jgi:hypothetical protein